MTCVTQEVAESESKQHSGTIGQQPDSQEGSPLVTVVRIARRSPVQRYNEEVADYRQHAANVSCDPTPMLASSLTVLHTESGSSQRFTKVTVKLTGPVLVTAADGTVIH
jgi:hypothetical protein